MDRPNKQPVWIQYSEMVWIMWYRGHLNDLVLRPEGIVWYYDGEVQGVYETLEEGFEAAEQGNLLKEWEENAE